MKNYFELQPLKSVGPIRFEGTQADIINTMGQPDRTFKRNKFSSWPLDQFDVFSCFINYDKNGKIEAVEFYEGAEVIYFGKNLMTLNFSKAKAFLSSLKLDFKEHDDSLLCHVLGISFYYPSLDDEPDNMPETLLTFKQGYWG